MKLIDKFNNDKILFKIAKRLEALKVLYRKKSDE